MQAPPMPSSASAMPHHLLQQQQQQQLSASEEERSLEAWREMVQASVECELCNEPYDDEHEHIPRLLLCGHTFCQSCLDGWASVDAHAGDSADVAALDCPTCRRRTTFDHHAGARSLPKNFELLRVRQEIEAQTQTQLTRLKALWATRVREKELLATEAQEHAKVAERESVQASQRAHFLARQVALNEQEKRAAQDAAEDARRKALAASQRAEALQSETEQLKQQLELEAQQLERVQLDATSHAAAAAALHSKAEQLQLQVDRVRKQLSLHAGRHDPKHLVVLVHEPTTVGSWLLPYTRYAVISIASDTALEPLDPFAAAKTWTLFRQVVEPSASVKVYRRYSDFVWLHSELSRKWPRAFVPRLPAKQLLFNKATEFVGARMRLLQAFVRQVLREPTLAVTEDVRAFLLATTEELETLRQASAVYSSSSGDGDDGADDSAVGDGDGQLVQVDASAAGPVPALPTTAVPVLTAPVVQSSAWAAWGAVSAITSSAAKLVTSTGSALTSSIGHKTATGSTSAASSSGSPTTSVLTADSDPRPELSASLLADSASLLSSTDPARARTIGLRRQYIDVSHAYSIVAQRGSAVARTARLASQHQHRLCELLSAMDALDTKYDARTSARAQVSPLGDASASRQLELRTFTARASEVVSALSLTTKTDADCMEYALLEVVRMQTLELGAIEDAFSRVRQREDAVQQQSSVSAGPGGGIASAAGSDWTLSVASTNSTSSPSPSRIDDVAAHRRELNAKVAALDPSRSLFVLETLARSAVEMHALAQTKRQQLEVLRQQLVAASRVQ